MNAGELQHVVVSQNGVRGLVKRTGFVRESDLQALVLSSPELLGPLGVDLRFAPIGWEVPVGPGMLDLLFIDSEGIPTLVETKLRANDESRRQVIGQVLEYASYASDWTLKDIAAIAERFYRSDRVPATLRDASMEVALSFWFGWENDPPEEQQARYEGLLAKAEASISAGRLRIVCGVDERIESLERLVRYFSAHSDLEVVLLQVNQFLVNEDTFVLVPSLHGSVGETTRRPITPTSITTLQNILDSFEEDEQRNAIQAFLDAAQSAGAYLEYGSNGLSVRVRTSYQTAPVTFAWVFPPGKWGWMRTKEISLGHGLDYETTAIGLRTRLDNYFAKAAALAFGNDASSKGVKARWFSPREFTIHAETVSALVTDVVHDLLNSKSTS